MLDIRGESVVAAYHYQDNYTKILLPLSAPESRMSAIMIIGKRKILSTKPEPEENINYYLTFY